MQMHGAKKYQVRGFFHGAKYQINAKIKVFFLFPEVMMGQDQKKTQLRRKY